MASRRLSKRYRLMLYWGIPCTLPVIVLGYVAWASSLRTDPSAPDKDGKIGGLTSVLKRDISSDMVRFQFEDYTQQSGIDFDHFPAVRQSLLPEDMGSGLAWGDYDSDGHVDLFLVNFRGSIDASQPSGDNQGRCALYRNNGNGTFTDVSQQAGVDAHIFGMAAAWGDYDNDHDLDLYVTAYGQNILYRNNGDGSFTDVTETAGVGDARFSAGCVWGDFDRDGWIDLYVTTYVAFQYREEDVARVKTLQHEVNPYTINPSSYEPDSNVLYRNNGNGTFTDVAQSAGVADPLGRSLGAIWFDFDNDQWMDLYVANDVSSNGVFRNLGNGTFEDFGAKSLAADYRGAMGLAVYDYEDDGDFDLLVTHWVAQENAFYVNMSADVSATAISEAERLVYFADRADAVGLGQLSLSAVGWATGFVDFDNDSQADLWVVNGNTLQHEEDSTQLVAQRTFIFRQQAQRGFFEIAGQACPRLAEPIVGRGGAHADFDDDGKMDLAIQIHGGQPILLRNTTVDGGHWLRLRLRQEGGNTFALGATVQVRSQDRVQTAMVGADGSYLSQSPTELHFGLGDATVVDSIRILWPDGHEDVYENIPADQRIVYEHTFTPDLILREGSSPGTS